MAIDAVVAAETIFFHIRLTALDRPFPFINCIVQVIGMDEPPLYLPIGDDAIELTRSALRTRLDELERWAATV